METGSPSSLPEWQDDQTMTVLFSPFRDRRDVNPSSWDRKMNFWTQRIRQLCVLKRQAVLLASGLPHEFERKGKVPVCLGIVIKEMLRTKKLVTLSEFYGNLNTSWFSWSVDLLVKKPVQFTYGLLIKKPLSWTYSKLFSKGEEQDLGMKDITGEPLVMIDLVKTVAGQILQLQLSSVEHEMTDLTVGVDELRTKSQSICSDEKTFQLALLWLQKEKQCLIHFGAKEKVVRFVGSNRKGRPELTENDLRIYRLKATEEILHKEIMKAGEEMEKCRLDAKMHLLNGKKNSAKNCLRRKKRLEGEQMKKESALDNVRQLLNTIQQADSDQQVLSAYSSGVSAFKDVTKRYGLTPEMVDDVMIGVQEVLEEHDDIERSMSRPPDALDDVSMDDLELELSGILAGDEGGLQDLPAVPDHTLPSLDQQLIDSVCRMRMAEDPELPAVPTHDVLTPPRPPARKAEATAHVTTGVAQGVGDSRGAGQVSPSGGIKWNSSPPRRLVVKPDGDHKPLFG